MSTTRTNTTRALESDRDAARRTLRALKPPVEIMGLVAGSQLRFESVLFMVAELIQIGGPLPKALHQQLEPWISELRRHRERVMCENRNVDMKPRRSLRREAAHE